MRRLSRNEVKTLTEVFIGHGNLAYHRHNKLNNNIIIIIIIIIIS